MIVTAIAIAAFFAAVSVTGITIRAARHLEFGVDESHGVQKMHSHWVPRLGGIPIFVAFIGALLLSAWFNGALERESIALIVAILPAFGIGLVEDVTRRAGIAIRFFFTMVAAALGWWLLGAQLNRLDLPLVDGWLQASPVFVFGLTVLAAAGLSHAVNIIDGCNGLSSFVSALVLVCLGIVAYEVGDEFVASASFLAAAAVMGFFVWNFPFGRIFLGDAGAYMVGFVIAEMSILLVVRNPEVSAWFPLLLMAYPVWETLFSMARRVKWGLSHISKPDALHMHQLILRRVLRQHLTSSLARNSATSPYLWALSLLCALPAVMLYGATPLLQAACLMFVATYCWLYGRLVRFRTPALIALTGRWLARADDEDAVAAYEG